MKLKLNIISSFLQKDRTDKVRVDRPTDSYYEGVAKRYSLLALVTVTLCVAVILVGFFVNKTMFTYKNLFYMFKDIDLAGKNSERGEESLTYPDGENQTFALYKNGLAVGSNHSLTLFTASGKQVMTDNFLMQNVRLKSSDGYIMIYELGGYNFSVYNSFSKLHSERTDYPIQLAEVSDSGNYAIVSASDTHASQVSVYDRNFNLKSLYGRKYRVSCVSMSPDGKRIAMVSVYVAGGKYCSEITLYEIGSKREEYTYISEGMFVLDCSLSDSGNLMLLSDKSLEVISPGGKSLTKYDFADKTLHKADMSEGACVLSFCNDAVNREYVTVYINDKGEVSDEIEISLDIDQIAIGKGCVYVLSADKITRIHNESGEISTFEYNCTGKKLLPCDEGGFLLCSSLRADYFDF